MITKKETLDNFNETLRRNPHYEGAGGFSFHTINSIREMLETATYNEKLIDQHK